MDPSYPQDFESDGELPPAPDGRVPSSCGFGITYRTPGPEGYDPRALEESEAQDVPPEAGIDVEVVLEDDIVDDD